MDNEDQMDRGSAGRMRGQSHVRIPQRRITRSLQTGVSPSMQPTAGNGQFQNGVHISQRVQPIRQMGPNRGRMFNQFLKRATGGHQQGNAPWEMQHMHNIHPQGNPIMQNLLQKADHFRGGRGPNGGLQFPGNRPSMQFPPNQHPVGGQPPMGPVGQPILGHGQTMNGMVQAIMDDLGQGINPAQFANMQAGTLPGGEHGDFLRALGGGAMNNNPLQALISHLVQGAAGADGTPGNYMINGDQGGDIAHILRQAIQHNPNYNPPHPPNGLFPPKPPRFGGGGFRNRRGQQFMPWGNGGGGFNRGGGMPAPIPLGIPQAGIPR